MDENIKKDKKKKSPSRKRDRLWKFIFPQDNKETIGSEQQSKIDSLSKFAQQNISVVVEESIFQTALERNDWDLKKAMVDLLDFEEATHGILIEPPSPYATLMGSENDGGTSCYIDSLLFAMFISITAFDPLLTYDIPSEEEEDNNAKIQLQNLVRLFVNKMRKGGLIKADFVHWLRQILQEAHWTGQDSKGNWSQEDASELFMFLTEAFDLPYLPFQIRLFHGANQDSDDDRLMTDRVLALSIPQQSSSKIKLEDILLDYFYNSVITGVKRQVERRMSLARSNSKTTNTIDPEKKQPISVPQASEEEVTAWQVLELIPFYSATNEQGESIQTQSDASFPDTHIILPIVLKRYQYDHAGGSTKLSRRVEIPSTIDFNRFVNQNFDDPTCPTCGQMIDWTLHIKSAVCHKGNSPSSGHYIAYSRVPVDGDEYVWLKLDDMDKEHRVTRIKEKNASSIYNDLAENGYIMLYELDKTCSHATPKDKTNNDGKKKQSHQHQHRYRLKESCNIM